MVCQTSIDKEFQAAEAMAVIIGEKHKLERMVMAGLRCWKVWEVGKYAVKVAQWGRVRVVPKQGGIEIIIDGCG